MFAFYFSFFNKTLRTAYNFLNNEFLKVQYPVFN